MARRLIRIKMKIFLALLSVICVLAKVSAEDEEKCPCECPRENATICGTDGRWYTECTLACEQCEHFYDDVMAAIDEYCEHRSDAHWKTEPENSTAPTNTSCPCKCPMEAGTICGTDGGWYTECTLKCEQCEHPEKNVEATDSEKCKAKPLPEKKPEESGNKPGNRNGHWPFWRPHWGKGIARLLSGITNALGLTRRRGTGNCSCECGRKMGTICGTDGRWYTECTLECKRCEYPEKNVEAGSVDKCKMDPTWKREPTTGRPLLAKILKSIGLGRNVIGNETEPDAHGTNNGTKWDFFGRSNGTNGGYFWGSNGTNRGYHWPSNGTKWNAHGTVKPHLYFSFEGGNKTKIN